MSVRAERRPSTGWRARASVLEGLANLRDGALLGTVLVALTAGMAGGAVLADVTAGERIVAAEAAYLDAGGDVLVAAHQEDRPVDAAACARLAGVAGVRAAFAADVVPGAAALVGRPEGRQTLVTATAGVLDLLDRPTLRPTEVLVAPTIADRWQWSAGTHLQLATDDALARGAPRDVLTVAEVVDLGRIGEAATTGVLLLRAATGPASACYVRVDPPYRDALRAALPAALGETAEAPIQVSDRLPPGAFTQDSARAFEERSTRWAGAVAGLVAGLLWALVAWTRRGRAALYASIGVPYAGGVLLRWTEGATVVVLGVVWGTALAVTAAVAVGGVGASLAVDLGLRGGLAALGAALLVVVLAGLWRPPTLAALKDR